MEELTEKQLAQNIYWEDLFALMEEQQEIWSQAYKMFKKLEYQNADPRLLQQVSLTINQMAEAFKALETMEGCFPQEPREEPIRQTLPAVLGSGPFRY